MTIFAFSCLKRFQTTSRSGNSHFLSVDRGLVAPRLLLASGVLMMAARIETFVHDLRRLFDRFRALEQGNVAVIFALTLIPIMTGVGAALDYSRANAAKALLQSALDTAILAGAKDGSSSWVSVASQVFSGNLANQRSRFPLLPSAVRKCPLTPEA